LNIFLIFVKICLLARIFLEKFVQGHMDQLNLQTTTKPNLKS